MDFIRQLLLYIALLAALFLLIGLFRPWVMLWWEHVQNRKKVIQLYGSIMIISYGLYWILFLVDK